MHTFLTLSLHVCPGSMCLCPDSMYLCPDSVCVCPGSIQIRYKGIKLSQYKTMYLRKHNMTTGEQVSIGSVNWPSSVLYACIHVCIIYVQPRVYMWYNDMYCV